MFGVWVLATKNGFDEETKFGFRSDGTFDFYTTVLHSKGRYKLDHDQLTLEWTDIEDEPMASTPVQKTVTLDLATDSLKLDNFVYYKRLPSVTIGLLLRPFAAFGRGLP